MWSPPGEPEPQGDWQGYGQGDGPWCRPRSNLVDVVNLSDAGRSVRRLRAIGCHWPGSGSTSVGAERVDRLDDT